MLHHFGTQSINAQHRRSSSAVVLSRSYTLKSWVAFKTRTLGSILRDSELKAMRSGCGTAVTGRLPGDSSVSLRSQVW